jgi:hypothetical protein
LLSYPLRAMDMFEHENLCLYLLHFNGTDFSVDRHNATDHLREFMIGQPQAGFRVAK